jgi:acyl-CoA thioesterase-2
VTEPEQPLDVLIRLLDIEPLEETLFRGVSPETAVQRVFGGQVAGQALVAAGRTVDTSRRVHSLHAYFLHAGDPSIPIVYSVDVTRDTRTMSTRRVSAMQHGRAIFVLTASFMQPEEGPAHQDAMPAAPDPESLPTFEQRWAPMAEKFPHRRRQPRPIDLRYVDDPWPVRVMKGATQPEEPSSQVWFRAAGALPDDPLLHVCVTAYASDMTLLDSVLVAQRLAWAEPDPAADTGSGEAVTGASLDHAMWFHAPFRADEWLLYVQEAPVTSDARGLARGLVFRADGRLAVSVVQEGLIRVSAGRQG